MGLDSYFTLRKIKCTNKLREVEKELPIFCTEFFIGIENKTSALTRLGYAQDLKIFFYYLVEEVRQFQGLKPYEFSMRELNMVTETHIEQYLSYLTSYERNGETYTNSVSAKARKLSAIRTMFTYFYKKNKLSENVTEKVFSPKIAEKEIVRLEADEVSKILDVAEFGKGLRGNQIGYNKITSKRDLAILTLFLGTGIRISELVGLDIEDVDFSANAFTITRKGGARVILYFSEEVAHALKLYLKERNANEKVPKDESAMFLSTRNQRLCVRAVEKLVKKYAKIASPLKRITPHKLRSTYGTSLYRETKDIYVVANVLGHRDVNTTKKHYAAISEDIRRDASTKVKLR